MLLDLRGVANAFVQPGKPDTAIEGSAQGINVVQVGAWVCGRRFRPAHVRRLRALCAAAARCAIPALLGTRLQQPLLPNVTRCSTPTGSAA